MALQKNVNIKVTAKTDQAVNAFEKLGKSQKATESNLGSLGKAWKQSDAEARKALRAFDDAVAKSKQLSAGMGQVGRISPQMIAGLKGAAAGAAALGVAAVGAAMKVQELAAESVQIQGVFQNLAFSLEPARQATRGLIDDMTLATSANSLTSLGVVKTSTEFAKLADAAQKLGSRLKLGPTETMNSLAAALGRGSSLMLDNLGIVVKEGDAHKRYAAQLGITVDKLTDAQKAEAFRKVAMVEIFKAAERITLETDGAAHAVQRFSVELENMRLKSLGATEGGVSLQDALARLDDRQRKLVASSRTYGADLDSLKTALIDAGVAYGELTDNVTVYSKVLAQVIRLEEEQRQRALESGELAREQVKNVKNGIEAMGQATQLAVKTSELMGVERALAALEGESFIKRKSWLEERIRLTKELEEAGIKASDVMTDSFRLELEGIRESNRELTKNVKMHKERVELAGSLRARLMEKGGQSQQFDAFGIVAGVESQEESIADAAREEAQRAADFEMAKADAILDARLAAIQRARDMGADPMSLALAEEQARQLQLDAADRYIRKTLEGEELLAAKRDIYQARFEANHQRAMAARARDAKSLQAYRAGAEKVGSAVVDVHTGVAEAVIRGAAAGDTSVKQMVATYAKSQALEMGILAATETIKGIAAAASLNAPQAAAHFTAAGLAAAQGLTLTALAGATGGFSGGGGGRGRMPGGAAGALPPSPGGGFRGGTAPPSLGGSPISRIRTPGTVGAQPQAPTTTSGGGSGPIHITVNHTSLTGATEKDMVHMLRKAIKQNEREFGPVR